MHIRKAQAREHQKLTKLTFESKGYWNYPDEYFDIWRDELTVTTEYIQKNNVFVVEHERTITGYYSLVHLPQDIEVSGIVIEKGYWLEHMFIAPNFIGKRIGTKMVFHLLNLCKDLNIRYIHVLADPNAQEFYKKMGFIYEMECPSTIPGRTTPRLRKEI